MFDIDPRQLIERADAAMEAATSDGYRTHRQVRREQYDALEAYRFAAALLGERGDVGDLARLAELHERVSGWMSDARLAEVGMESLGGLLEHAAPGSDAVARLARSARAGDRLAVAKHLDIRTAEGQARVAALATDPDRRVRAAARKRLPDLAPPWWAAAFSRDPMPHLTPEMREALEPALRQVIDGIDQAAQHTEPLCAALERLPTPLVFDVVTRIFATRPRRVTWERPLLSLVVERPDGLRVLRECLGQVQSLWGLEPADGRPWLLRGSPQRRAELALALAESVLAGDGDDDVTSALAELVGSEWPPEIDPSPLVERASARPDWPHCPALLAGLRHNAHAATWGARVLEARLAGDDRLDRLLGGRAHAVVDAAPSAVVRPLAERGLLVAGCVQWAVDALLGRCHQPEKDPPPEVLAEAWLAVPAMATAVRKARPDLAQGWMRERLARGAATMAEVGLLVLSGELDDEAWALVRKARAEALSRPEPEYIRVVTTLIPERWGPDEWAAVDAVLEGAPHLVGFVVEVLCQLTTREAAPRVERALALSPEYLRGELLAHRARLAQLHGLELGPPPAAPEDADD